MGKANLLGPWGEATAAEYLRKKRYELVAAGYRSRFGEIDLIVKDRKYIIFVEVKLRKSSDFAKAREFVDRKKQDPDFDPGSIDVVVEIIDPKHHDIVNSYSVNKVVISNRYISKMIAQIGEVEALFDFYADILSYDEEDTNSKEIYIKKASRYFDEIPGLCTARQLIRAVLDASTDESLPEEKRDPNFVIGYVRKNGEMVIFGGDQSAVEVKLEATDKLILFASH